MHGSSHSTEPVWNAAIAALVLHEQLDAAEIAGGAFIVLGALLAADASGDNAEAS